MRSVDSFFPFLLALESPRSVQLPRDYSDHLRARQRINYQFTRARMHAHETLRVTYVGTYNLAL